MMNKLEIEAYRQIKAPVELKSAVMQAASKVEKKKSFLNIRTVSSIAACFVMLMVGIMFMFRQNANVEFTVENLPVVAAYSENGVRNSGEQIGVITLKSDSEIKIESIGEDFYLIDDSGVGEAVRDGSVFDKEVKLGWIISADNGYIKVNGREYRVSYSEADSTILINEIKK